MLRKPWLSSSLMYRRPTDCVQCTHSGSLKQVVTTGYLTNEQKAAGETEILTRTVDCNNNFGGRGSGRVWYSVIGLVTWIAINVENIEDLGCYVDDDFGI